MMRDGGDWWQTGWGFAGQFVMDGGAQVFVASHPCDSLFLEKQSQQWGTEHWLLGRFDSETWKTTNPNQPRPWEERQPLGLRLPTIADNALVQTAQLHTAICANPIACSRTITLKTMARAFPFTHKPESFTPVIFVCPTHPCSLSSNPCSLIPSP